MASPVPSAQGYFGAAFDGRYVYFAPNYNNFNLLGFHGLVARYDTAANFSVGSSWSFYNATAQNYSAQGFQGAVFDGRYVYFVPSNVDSIYNGLVTRYDTTSSFGDASSWGFFNMTAMNTLAKGYSGAVFDGKYVYFVPFVSAAASGSHGFLARMRAYAPSSVDVLGARYGSSKDFYVDGNGNVGLGSVVPNATLFVNGTAESGARRAWQYQRERE
jgi:hypothetical protein